MSNWFSDVRTFWRENRLNFKHTGSVLPSGHALGRALTHFVRHRDPKSNEAQAPRRLLEVGPGTGAVTRHLCEQLSPGDSLDVVELNGAFVEVLRRRLREEPPFSTVADRVTVHHCPIEKLPSNVQYDLIVSCLPFNNFEVAEVEHILGLFAGLLKPTGTLSFFQYIGINKLRVAVNGSKGRLRLRGVARSLDDFVARGEIRRDHVWANFPPAYVHHVRIGS